MPIVEHCISTHTHTQVKGSSLSKNSVHPDLPRAECEFSNIFAARLAAEEMQPSAAGTQGGHGARAAPELRSSMRERESADGGVTEVRGEGGVICACITQQVLCMHALKNMGTWC